MNRDFASKPYQAGSRSAHDYGHTVLTDRHGVRWTGPMLFHAFAGASCVGLFLASLLIAGKVLL